MIRMLPLLVLLLVSCQSNPSTGQADGNTLSGGVAAAPSAGENVRPLSVGVPVSVGTNTMPRTGAPFIIWVTLENHTTPATVTVVSTDDTIQINTSPVYVPATNEESQGVRFSAHALDTTGFAEVGATVSSSRGDIKIRP